MDQAISILKKIGSSDLSDEMSGKVLARAMELLTDAKRAGSSWQKILELSPNDAGDVLRNFGRVLASPASSQVIAGSQLVGRRLLEAAVDRFKSFGYFKDISSNSDAANNLKYLAEDLATIAQELERTRPSSNLENLNWVLKKLGENVGSDNMADGKLHEVAAMAKILKAAPNSSDIQLGRKTWYKVPGLGEVKSDMDVVDQISKTFYEVKTTAEASKKKLKPGQQKGLKDVEQIASQDYSQVFVKMIVHQTNNPGKKFELWTDTGGNPEALESAVKAVITNLGKKLKLEPVAIRNLSDNFKVVDHPKRYTKIT